MTEQKPPDRRILGVVLALVAAGALAFACITKVWLYNPRNKSLMEVGFGLVSNFECESEATNCRTMTNSALVQEWQAELAKIRKEAKDSPSDLSIVAFAANAEKELRAPSAFPPLGWVTLVACGLAALSLLACAVLVLAKKRIAWPIMPTTIAILGIAVGLITGCVFVAMKPGPPGYVGVGLGFWAFGGGVVVGIAAALMINKHLRPRDEDSEWA
jgi:hypothetical protein